MKKAQSPINFMKKKHTCVTCLDKEICKTYYENTKPGTLTTSTRKTRFLTLLSISNSIYF